jgi:fructose-1,6-bisphosphatase I
VKQADQVTLTEYLLEHQRSHPEATGELTELLNRIALCGKIIARRLRRSTLTGETGYAATSNVYGERQEKLDVFANEVFLRHLRYGGIVSIAASEEMDEPKMFDADGTGHYTVSFDPIDGSSNLDVNGTLGTIFGIRRREAAGKHDHGLLTSGREQVAAGYLLYGPATEIVIATGFRVAIFTLDDAGEFFLSKDGVQMPRSGKAYAVNEGNESFWKEGTRRYVAWLKTPDPKTRKAHATRYSASLVGDFHRILQQGGIYLYPEDSSDPKKPDGKLRVLYECHPLALVAEYAGGRASTGTGDVLDVLPADNHARCPLAIGSKDEVDRYDAFMAGKG